jgi:hypothetical protein
MILKPLPDQSGFVVASCSPWPPLAAEINGILERTLKEGQLRQPMRTRVLRPGDLCASVCFGNCERATSDNDKPRLSTLFGRPKISCFDPLLTTVWTPYATQPFLPLLHPKVEIAGSGPRG